MSTTKRRLAISERERQQIRQYAQANPLLRQTDIARWASQIFGHKINQSIVCKSLHSKWSYLDTKVFPESESGTSRNCKADYPLLESALFEWTIYMESSEVLITGELIKEAASSLWQLMPDFQHLKEPSWSQGWLSGFRRRHNMKPSKQNWDVTNPDVAFAGEVQSLQYLMSKFNIKDIFNADETGLFWFMPPDNTLAVSLQSDSMRKNMITILPACNMDGSEKLNPWIIGHCENPPSFGHACCYSNNLPFTWRHNNNAWMTTPIFIEYLHWFDNQMQGRQVLLLIDKLAAHVGAVRQLKGQAEVITLKNTTVAFIPANPTTNNTTLPFQAPTSLSTNRTLVFQPMSLGIIRDMKVHYRNAWLQHVFSMTMEGKDPYQNTTILSAIHWVIYAWRSVTPDTISHCWGNSRFFRCPPPTTQLPTRPEEKDLQQVIARTLIRQGLIKDIKSLVNPPEEAITDNHENLIQHIAKTFSEGEGLGGTAEQQEVERIPAEEALKAVNELLQFEVQQVNVSLEKLEQLRRSRQRIMQMILNKKLYNGSHGGTLDLYAKASSGST